MATLHEVDTDDATSIEDCYSTALAGQGLPKRRMPEGPSLPGAVRDLILDELALDGNASQNLATFCSTFLDHAAHELMAACIDKTWSTRSRAAEPACVRIAGCPGNASTGSTARWSAHNALGLLDCSVPMVGPERATASP